MADPRQNPFFDAYPGLGGRSAPPVPTPPVRLPTDMAGPSPPRGPMPLVQMQGNPPAGTEDGYYGAPTREMLRRPDIDLSAPVPDARTDPETQEFMRDPRNNFTVPPGKTFIDRIEDNGMAVLLDPGSEQSYNLPARAGWKEGMYIDPPRKTTGKAQPRKRRAVP